LLALIMLFPVFWMLETSFKNIQSIYANPPEFLGWSPTLENYRNVFVERGGTGEVSDLVRNFANSVVIAIATTVLTTLVGVPAAWAYSRFSLKGEKDQLFSILATRFLPPVVVVIPLFVMWREIGLYDTHLGLVLLYIGFNLPLTIWMMKGFIDEIPADYEEAAMTDGYSRLEAASKISLPMMLPGIAATAVFTLIFTWNEFVFAIFLTNDAATTVPPAIAGLIGGQQTPWGLVAASAMVFGAPVVLFGTLVRKHLATGMSFGAVRR
jgi:multiple sugar transport system permease protein